VILALVLAVVGVGQNRDGTLLLGADQVVECGQGDGEFLRSHPNGKVALKGRCKGGVYVGTWKSFFANGEKQWQVDFEAGRPNGTFRSWYETGQEQTKTEYKNGPLEGKYKWWWPNGKLAVEGHYKAGQKSGCWETYNEKGEHSSKGAYVSGKQVGTWLNWDDQQNKRRDKFGGEPTEGKCLILL
jgi:antitoxin component YwqK of YwqJK toxin-antitoxin module